MSWGRITRTRQTAGQGRGDRGRVLSEWKCRQWRTRSPSRCSRTRAARGSAATRTFHNPPGIPLSPDTNSTSSAIDIAWSFFGLSRLGRSSSMNYEIQLQVKLFVFLLNVTSGNTDPYPNWIDWLVAKLILSDRWYFSDKNKRGS